MSPGPVLLAAALAWSGAALAQGMPPDFGPDPRLPPPKPALIPTIKVAEAVGWPKGAAPKAAAGLAVAAYASGLAHPRWLYVLPNGDVLVAETNRPPGQDEQSGLKEAVMKRFMKKAGAAVPSADRITLLRGVDANGAAATRSVFMSAANGLMSPFGMALVGEQLYIANADALVRVPYQEGALAVEAKAVKVLDLPAGRNHHWTKGLVASPDGRKLYVAVGSNSNVAEHGMAIEEGRAAIWEYDIASGKARLFATGLRNPVGMDFNPHSGQLWTAVNERDALGDELVPDYITSVQEGGFYGWPYSYYGQVLDPRVEPQRPALVARAIKPDYAVGAHTASLGLAFYHAGLLPQYRNGALIGQHGSWNRRPMAGYKLVFVPFAEGKPNGPPEIVLTGFLGEYDDKAYGRPVGVAVDRQGAILLADDVGNTVWRITPAAK